MKSSPIGVFLVVLLVDPEMRTAYLYDIQTQMEDKQGLSHMQFSPYQREELLDLEYVHSIGGWPFIQIITPLFLKGSRDALSRIKFCSEEGNLQGVRFGLHKMMGTANAIGALKIVRSILAIQLLIDRKEPNLEWEISILEKQLIEVEEFLTSIELQDELKTSVLE